MAPGPAGGSALAEARRAMRLSDLDPGRAMPVAAAAVRLARRDRDSAATAVAERAWGQAMLHCGDMDGAIRHLRRAIASGDRAGSAVLSGEARMSLGFALLQRGRPWPALREVDAALLVLDGVAAAKARAQRAVILHQTGRLDAALAEYQVALPVLRQAGDLQAVQRALLNRGTLHAQCNAFAAAVADYRESEELANRIGRTVAIGIIAENLGFVDTLRGDVPSALVHLGRAERLLSDHGIQLGPIAHDRGELLLSVGLVSEAREAAGRAVLAFRRERRSLRVPEGRLLLAQVDFLDGRWPEAMRHADQAAREFGRQQRPEWAALARLAGLRARLALRAVVRMDRARVESMVNLLAANGWRAATVEAHLVAARLAGGAERGDHLATASRAARRPGPAVLRARGWYAEGLLRLDGGNRRGATAAARAGLRILDEYGASLGATDLRVHSAAHRRDLTELGLRIAVGAGRPAGVFEWAERGRASRLAHRPVRPPDDPELAGLLARLRATAMEADRLSGTGRGAARLVQRQVELERRIRDHTRLRRGTPDGRPPGPVSPAALAGVLGDAALVEFVTLDGELRGISLVDGRLRLRSVGPVDEVAGLVERLPFALHRMVRDGGPAGSRAAAVTLLRQAAERLDTVLLRPFPEVGDRPLVIVPTGALHSVPWSILPSCAGRPVAVAPSATLWHATSTRAAGAGGTVMVAAGPRLPGARDEAAAVAAVHGVAALVDGAATAAAVLRGLATAGLVHLAAHGRLSAENPLFSDLLLADGPLVVHDIEQLDDVPHTVVLAACDSGRSVVRAGDELLGLSATFIARGAAQLVASVLPIPDAETAPLMVAFHRRLAAGQPPAVALAGAQQERGDDEPAALAAAAGFVCLGHGLGHPRR